MCLGGVGRGACSHTHAHLHTYTPTHIHTHVDISEHRRGWAGFGCSRSTRLQVHLKMNESQSQAIKHVAYFKCLL